MSFAASEFSNQEPLPLDDWVETADLEVPFLQRRNLAWQHMATAWQQSAGAGSGGGQSGHLQFLLVASGEAGQVRAQALGFFATSDFF